MCANGMVCVCVCCVCCLCVCVCVSLSEEAGRSCSRQGPSDVLLKQCDERDGGIEACRQAGLSYSDDSISGGSSGELQSRR